MENQLSIIIPCYNVAEYLPVTLDSILSRQNFSSLEIILIDDGSTDNTLNVIRRSTMILSVILVLVIVA